MPESHWPLLARTPPLFYLALEMPARCPAISPFAQIADLRLRVRPFSSAYSLRRSDLTLLHTLTGIRSLGLIGVGEIGWHREGRGEVERQSGEGGDDVRSEEREVRLVRCVCTGSAATRSCWGEKSSIRCREEGRISSRVNTPRTPSRMRFGTLRSGSLGNLLPSCNDVRRDEGGRW